MALSQVLDQALKQLPHTVDLVFFFFFLTPTPSCQITPSQQTSAAAGKTCSSKLIWILLDPGAFIGSPDGSDSLLYEM